MTDPATEAAAFAALPPAIFNSEWSLRRAETEMLFTCALRFDGYRFQDETGQDLQAMLAALIERDVMPADHNQRLAVFFLLQRGLGKWGLERATADSNYWGVFRRLFLAIHDRPVPERYAAPEYMQEWAARYADQTAAWAALVDRIHVATAYVSDAAAFSADNRDTVAAHRTVVADVSRAAVPPHTDKETYR